MQSPMLSYPTFCMDHHLAVALLQLSMDEDCLKHKFCSSEEAAHMEALDGAILNEYTR